MLLLEALGENPLPSPFEHLPALLGSWSHITPTLASVTLRGPCDYNGPTLTIQPKHSVNSFKIITHAKSLLTYSNVVTGLMD